MRSRRLAAGASLAALLVLATSGCTAAPSAPEVTTLPEVTLSRFEGSGQVDLSGVKGPAVVNLWASWCGPCRAELPVIEQFHQRYGEEVKVIGVDYQDVQNANAVKLAEESGLTYELLTDLDGELDGAPPFPALQGLPFWAFVDADGTVVHQEFVAFDSLEELRTLVDTYLGTTL